MKTWSTISGPPFTLQGSSPRQAHSHGQSSHASPPRRRRPLRLDLWSAVRCLDTLCFQTRTSSSLYCPQLSCVHSERDAKGRKWQTPRIHSPQRGRYCPRPSSFLLYSSSTTLKRVEPKASPYPPHLILSINLLCHEPSLAIHSKCLQVSLGRPI